MKARQILPEKHGPAKRNTVQRDLVLEAVSLMGSHPTSAEVYEHVRLQHPSISRATVYRNLDVLALDGKILKIDIPQGAARYDRTLMPHYHARCQQCGSVIDVDVPVFDDLNTCLENTNGFSITGHQILFEGTCILCQAKSSCY